MDRQFTLRSRILLCSGLLALAMSPVYADPACDAEVAAIQVELDAPAAGISAADLEQAQQLFNVLSADCGGGTPLDTAAPLAQQIRSLLGMGVGS